MVDLADTWAGWGGAAIRPKQGSAGCTMTCSGNRLYEYSVFGDHSIDRIFTVGISTFDIGAKARELRRSQEAAAHSLRLELSLGSSSRFQSIAVDSHSIG